MNSNRVSDFMSRKICSEKFSTEGTLSLVAYPQNDAKELAKIMTDIRIECVPVFFSPWKRKLIGFVELSKISVLND